MKPIWKNTFFVLFLGTFCLPACRVESVKDACAPGDTICDPLQWLLLQSEPAPDLRVEYVYWADGTNSKVHRLEIETGSMQTIVTGVAVSQMAIGGGKIIYNIAGGSDPNYFTMNLDGSDQTVLVNSGNNNTGGMYYYGANETVYYAQDGLGTIRSIKLDGSNDTLIASGFSNPTDIAVHDDQIFFAEKSNDAIRRMSLDGSNLTTLADSSNGVNNPVIMDIDPIAGKIYWVETPAPSNIRRVNIDGNAFETIADAPTSLLTGIAVDAPGSLVYSTDSTALKISRGNLNGTNGSVFLSSDVSVGDIELTFKELD